MKRKKTSSILLYLILGFGALIFVFPYIYMIIASTQTNAEILGPTLDLTFGGNFIKNITEVQVKYNYIRVLFNSIFVTVVGTLLSTFITTLAGYVMAKFDLRAGNLMFNLVMLARMVPQFALIIPTFYILSKLGLTNSLTGIIIISLASMTSVFMMRQYAQAFPTELLESGRIDGAGEWTIFFKIAIPVLMPAIVTTGLLNFMAYWNAYLFPLVMLSDTDKFTVPLVIKSMTQNNYDPLNYGALMAILATSVIPVIGIYIILQNKFTASNLDSAIK